MKKLILLAITIHCSLITAYSQAPAIEWQKSLGGSGVDVATSVKQNSDGGYIVAGYSNSVDGDITAHHGTGYYDGWIVRLDNSGALQWEKSLGGTNEDELEAVQQTSDGGFITAGDIHSIDGDGAANHSTIVGIDDFWVVKLDGSGNVQWNKCLGGTTYDRAFSIQQTVDGGYITVGNSWSDDGDVSGHHGSGWSDCWVVKLDGSGNIQWQKSFGGTDQDEAYSIQQTTDGGYIFAGNTKSNDGDVTGVTGHQDYPDYWVVKLDGSGNIQWQRTLGGTDDDYARSVQQTSDGGYIVDGYSSSIDGDVTGHHSSYDSWVVKLNAAGAIEWEKSLGGSDFEYGYSVQQTSDGGYIAGGSTQSLDGDASGHHGTGYGDYWAVKLNATGGIVWQKCLGGVGEDFCRSTQQTADGYFIMAGESISNDGDVTGNHTFNDYWVVKLKAPVGIEENEDGFGIRVYPNPNEGIFAVLQMRETKLTIEITNPIGELIYKTTTSNLQTNLDISKSCKGIYFVKVSGDNGSVATKKVNVR